MEAGMGRRQLWDRDEVLASAMRLFRHRGYLGASLRDIEEATGLHPGSLYRTFQSKDGLFHAALDIYNERVVQGRVRVHLLEPHGPAGLHPLVLHLGDRDRYRARPGLPAHQHRRRVLHPSPDRRRMCTTAWQ